DLVKQGALLPMDSYMSADAGFQTENVAASVKVNNETYMFAVASFTYHLFANTGLLKEAGIEQMPKTWSEFETACKAVSAKNPDAYGWDFPFSSLYASAGQDQLMSWAWATGGKMLDEEGKPCFVGNSTLQKTFEFFKKSYDDGIMSPGVFSKQSQDMFEEFASGRSAFMLNGLSAIASLYERNSELEFDVWDMPVADDYTGKKGMLYAAWGIGLSASSKHPDEAWKLISYLMSTEVSSRIAEIANSLPGNKQSTAASDDPAFLNGYRLFQESNLINEFIGMPSANELNRLLMEQVQLMLQNNQSVETTLANIQSSWEAELAN
ncbi:MAG: extracellular solute-binding protein, partial [Clostridia bacterium]